VAGYKLDGRSSISVRGSLFSTPTTPRPPLLPTQPGARNIFQGKTFRPLRIHERLLTLLLLFIVIVNINIILGLNVLASIREAVDNLEVFGEKRALNL
jgi:hypothetical protein